MSVHVVQERFGTRKSRRSPSRAAALALGAGLLLATADVHGSAVLLAQAGRPAPAKVAKMGSLVGDTHPTTVATRAFADLVKQRTGGSVDVQVFPNAQLGGEREVAEGMLLGSVQAHVLNLAVLGNWVPEAQLFDMPFVFRDNGHAQRVTNGPIGLELADKLAQKGFRVVGYWLSGVRHPLSKTAINTPADVKGKKMRVIQSPLHVGLWRSLGAIPTPLPHTEVYGAMQSGVVDFFDNAKSAYWEVKFYEVAPYLIDLGHIYAIGALTFSERFWKELTPDQQKAIQDAGREFTPRAWDLVEKDEAESVKKVVEKGAKVIQPDKRPWQDAMAPFWDEWGPRVGGRQQIQRILDSK